MASLETQLPKIAILKPVSLRKAWRGSDMMGSTMVEGAILSAGSWLTILGACGVTRPPNTLGSRAESAGSMPSGPVPLKAG